MSQLEIQADIDLATRMDCMSYAEKLKDNDLMIEYASTVKELVTIALNNKYDHTKTLEENFSYAYIAIIRDGSIPCLN